MIECAYILNPVNKQAQLTNVQENKLLMRRDIMWTKPEYSDMRFGFEVTMYICNR